MRETIRILYHKHLISIEGVDLVLNRESGVLVRYIYYTTYNTLLITENGIIKHYKNSTFDISWEEFESLSIGYTGGMVFFGNEFFYIEKEFYSFFKELQNILKNGIQSDEEAWRLLRESREQMDIIEEKINFYTLVAEGFTDIRRFN